MKSTATIPTPKASGYLQQLCKHFSHKIPVEFTPDTGRITFEMGMATLSATDTVLTMHADAETPEQLERLEGVMGRHLERFAFREPLAINWVRN
ncbi:DUF2218 domain-containing protein [Falsirhodobacter deserti]|uniref:DUF2218 domain-containing protein n=1 Tax=Falsirhodobacter deserti TaxID=1365611 RepID=UPI000FE2E504|nr:DUF2218 domain-containing protein [Falsirhodobacter deserti]